MRLGVGWYTPATFAALREVSDDRDTLPPTFEAWQREAAKLLFILRGKGLDPEQFFVDIDELVGWCKQRRVPLNAESRANFVREKVGAAPKSGPLRF